MPVDYPSIPAIDELSAGRTIRRSIAVSVGVLLPLVCLAGIAVAQTNSTGGTAAAFCDTSMAETMRNVFTLIQFGGPLIGGALALGATVALPVTRRSNIKKEMKSIRNQGLLYGVIIAPLGTEVVQFMLNNVVAGGSSCAF